MSSSPPEAAIGPFSKVKDYLSYNKIHAAVPSETSLTIYKTAGPPMLEDFRQELLIL